MSCTPRISKFFDSLYQYRSRFSGLLWVLLLSGLPAAATGTVTTTTLTATSGRSAVTTVRSGTAITLTATVQAGATALKVGQVNFCDASAVHCTDIHLIGTSQLTSAGTAALKFFPGIGGHSYKAVFHGTAEDSASASSPLTLTVTKSGVFPTTVTIASSGSQGDYALTATVTGIGWPVSPTGTVSFLDTSNGNSVMGTAALGTGAAGMSFYNSSNPGTGYNPTGLVAGDFNGDGKIDLAAANTGADTVTVLLGNGDGTFMTAATVATGRSPGSVAEGDFNGDGKLDLAVTNFADNTVTVLLGNGDGTFMAAASPATGSYPTSIAAGDFNGDGVLDLAVANYVDNTVTVLLGKGDGTFTATASPATGSYPENIAAGDFNGDGVLDLAVANNQDNTVTVLLGKGDGTFTATASPATGSYPMSIAVGDFNGDGVLDLAVANNQDNTVTVLLGKGDGTFTTAASPTAGDYPESIAVGDFNEDGIADLAVGGAGSTVLLGNGDGSFRAVADGIALSELASIAVADFNGDGVADQAAGGNDFYSLNVYLTEMTQTATATASGIAFPGTAIHNVEASYPGDTNYSASVSNAIGLRPTPTETATTLQAMSGSTAVTTVGSGSVVTLAATVQAGGSKLTEGQVNFCDASAAYCTGTHILGTSQLTNSGIATLKFIPGIGSHSYKAVFLGSIGHSPSTSNTSMLMVTGSYSSKTMITLAGNPGDYILTGTVVGVGGQASPTGSVSFIDTTNANTVLGTSALGMGTPGLSFANVTSNPTALLGFHGPLIVTTGDFNGDGIADLAAADTFIGVMYLELGNGDGTFSSSSSFSIGGNLSSLVVADFNGDGKADLAVDDVEQQEVILLLGNGDGTFTPSNAFFGPIPTQIAVGDFNGDGIADIAAAAYSEGPMPVGQIAVLLGKGDGTFPDSFSLNDSVEDPGAIATGDFNGDGFSDIVVTDSETMKVLLSKGDGTFTTSATITAGNNATSIATGDFNGDGKIDIAIPNSTANTVEVLLGNGDGTFTAAASPATGKGPYFVETGDFNGDGKLDLAISNSDGTLTVLLGGGDGTFAAAPVSLSTGNLSAGFAAGDFNGDGVTDIAAFGNLECCTIPINVQVAQPLQTGTATASEISPLGTGMHQVVASFPGDGNYDASTSSAVSLIAVTPMIALSPTLTSLTINSAGGSATETIQVSSVQGFSGTVSLSCKVIYAGAAKGDLPTCGLNPQQSNVTAASPLTVTLTIGTTASSSNNRTGVWLRSGGVLVCLAFFGFPPRRCRRAAGLLSLIGAACLAIGCGASPHSPENTGTATGSYQIAVAAVGSSVMASTTISLNLQ
jgi:hypothetical protein